MFFKPNVERLEKRRDARGLIKALGGRDAAVREAAGWALARLGDPHGQDFLLSTLPQRPRAQQRKALELIAAGAFDPAPIAALLQTPGMEGFAIRAIAKSTHPATRALFAGALRSEIFELQRIAAEKLDEQIVRSWADELSLDDAVAEATLLGRVCEDRKSALVDDAILCIGHRLQQSGRLAEARRRVGNVVAWRWDRLDWSSVVSNAQDWKLDDELAEIDKAHPSTLARKLGSDDARVGRAAAAAFLSRARLSDTDALYAPLIAVVLRRAGDDDALARLCAGHPVGTSWGPSHRLCLDLVRNRERVIERLRNFDRPAAVHSLMYLASPTDERWNAIAAGRISDYDTADPENRSLQGNKDYEIRQQEDFNQRAAEAIRQGDDAVRAFLGER